MPFEKGHKKIGGRKAGTPNKLWGDILIDLEALQFDPVAELLKVYPALENEKKSAVCLQLMSYLYSKPKYQEQPESDMSSLNNEDLRTIVAMSLDG